MEPHGIGLLPTLVASLLVAFLGGIAARVARLSPVFGYLLAGVALGPYTPGITVDQKITTELAEIGVALLLFGVGLHFSFNDLLAVRRSAVPGALIQITVAGCIGYVVATTLIGLPPSAGWVIGLSLAIASTAVATRALEERGQLTATPGKIALGWLVAQDIVVILALTMVPVVSARHAVDVSEFLLEFGRALAQIAGFVAIIVIVGKRAIPWLLGYVARIGSRELFTLAVIVVALGIAYGSAMLFGISLALAAFFAGVALGESDLSHQAAGEALPMQQVFAVLFFVSIGMLFDPKTLLDMPIEIAALLVAIVVGTGLTTTVVLLVMRASPETAALVGASFAQIGEFSFILTEQAVQRNLVDTEVRNLVVAVALLAIVLNPLMFPLARGFAIRVATSPAFARLIRRRSGITLRGTPHLTDHAILVGHGRVGRTVASALRAHGLNYIVVESDRKLAEKVKAEGVRVVYGDATHEDVLRAALPLTARLIVVALPDAFQARQVIALARKLNPEIETVVRTHSEAEALYLAESGVGLAVMGEREIAVGMSDFALQRLGVEAHEARATVDQLRSSKSPDETPA
ncbi:MAG: cation:proton antiporter [Xanthobacteraceae bacterium]